MQSGNNADKSNEDKFCESTNTSHDHSEPTVVACFCHISHHMKNKNGRLNLHWILLDNQSTVHIFSNRTLLANIKDTDVPIGIYSSVGANHCDTKETLENSGDVYLHKNGLANILSYTKVRDKHRITYDDVGENFTVRTPSKWIHFCGSKEVCIIITATPTEINVTSRFSRP